MTATQIQNAKTQFIDINGKPLVGGTVGMYVVNTLIPKTTWQDAEQQILNQNPIPLDSRGQAMIYGGGAYRQILKDSLGNIIWDEPVYGNGGGLPVVTPEMFGAAHDGTTNDAAAFAAALDYLNDQSGGFLLLLPGPDAYAYASGSGSLTVPNNVTVTAPVSSGAAITVTGAGELNGIFVATNPSDVWIENISLIGNSVCSTAGTAGAIYFYGAPGATAEMTNFGTRNCNFQNFKQDYWVYHRNDSSFAMRHVQHYRPSALSFSGNMRDPTINGVPSAVIASLGCVLNAGGLIVDANVIEPDMDGTWIKQATVFWSGVMNSKVVRGTLRNFGANASPDASGYAILVYDNSSIGPLFGPPPTQILIDGVNILNPFSAGVYGAGAAALSVVNCSISGQSDADTTLPHYAIVFNGCSGGTFGNRIRNNLRGIFASPLANDGLNLVADEIISTVAGGQGITIGGAPGVTNSNSFVNVVSPFVFMLSVGSGGIELISSTSGNPIGQVNIDGGSCASDNFALVGRDSGGGGIFGTAININDITLKLVGNTDGQMFSMTGTACPIRVSGVVLDGTDMTAASIGMDIRTATQVNLDGIILKNKVSGAGVMLSCTGTRGSMLNTQFINVGSSQRVTSSDFGTAVPGWSATQGTFIQNLNPTGAGHLHGYTNTSSGGGTSWVED